MPGLSVYEVSVGLAKEECCAELGAFVLMRRVKRRVLSLQVGTCRISEGDSRAHHALWLAWQPLDRPDHRLLLISRIGAHQGGMRPMVNLWLILR